MKKKIFILSIPISLSILGIIYLQVDWMRKTYGVEFAGINKIADYALANAVAKVNEENVQEAVQAMYKTLPPPSNRGDISCSPNFDSLTVYAYNKHDVKPVANVTSFTIGRLKFVLPIEQVEKQSADLDMASIFNGLNEAMAPPPFFKIDASDSLKILNYFKENLKKANLDIVPNETNIFFVKGEKDSKSPPNYQQLSIGTPKTMGIGLKFYQPSTLFSFATKRIWVGAYFQNHQKQVMARMMYGSLLSMALVVVMIVCFLYLIGLLMKQKRIGEMKDDFISNLTHEFKTPISTISAAMEAMQNFNALKDPEKTARYLKVSRAELLRLDAMVTKVLDIASYESKTLELDLQKVDISLMIKEITENEQLRADHLVEFTLILDPEVKTFLVDENHFRNVIVNLVDNAIKYAERDVKIKIKV